MSGNDVSQFSEIFGLFQFRKVLMLIISMGVLVLLVRFLQGWSKKMHEFLPSRKLLILQLTTMLSFFIYILGTAVLVYGILKPPKELMLAIGGSVAVAVGFSLKDLVGSLIAGIILLFDRPFQVGDRVQFGDVYGEIVSIGLRAVRLNTLDDSLVTIPNGRFFTDIVSSGNSGALDMMVVIDFHLSLDSDFDLANALLYEVAVTSPYIYMDKPVAIIMSEVSIAGRLAMKLSVKAYVFDVAYEKAFQTNITKRGVRCLKENGIGRPILFEATEVTPLANH